MVHSSAVEASVEENTVRFLLRYNLKYKYKYKCMVVTSVERERSSGQILAQRGAVPLSSRPSQPYTHSHTLGRSYTRISIHSVTNIIHTYESNAQKLRLKISRSLACLQAKPAIRLSLGHPYTQSPIHSVTLILNE